MFDEDRMGPLSSPDEDTRLRDLTATADMRKQYGKIGFSICVLLAVWFLSLFLITNGLTLLSDAFGQDSFFAQILSEFSLLINEIALGFGILVSLLILRGLPRAVLPVRAFSASSAFRIFCICVAVGVAGNLISNLLLSFWNLSTGHFAENDVLNMASMENPWSMFLSVGIMAPVLEEWFFRKLLIDRTRQYGEMTCILTSAILFALFHQNFSQLFYAFGIGLLLAYVYCRSGKLWLTILLHSIFNCFSGVFPVLLLKEIYALFGDFPTMDPNAMLDVMLQNPLKNSLLFLVFFFQNYLTYACAIVGLVFFIMEFRRFRAESGPLSLSFRSCGRALGKSYGMIVAVVFLIFLAVLSLF